MSYLGPLDDKDLLRLRSRDLQHAGDLVSVRWNDDDRPFRRMVDRGWLILVAENKLVTTFALTEQGLLALGRPQTKGVGLINRKST